MRKNIGKFFLVGFLVFLIGLSGSAEAKSTKSKTKTKNSGSEKTVRVKLQVKAANGKIKKVKAKKRTIPGVFVKVETAAGVAGTSSEGATNKVTFTKGKSTYVAYLTANTQIVNRKGAAIALTDFAARQKISVRGSVTGTDIYKVIKLRNVTLPVDTTETD